MNQTKEEEEVTWVLGFILGGIGRSHGLRRHRETASADFPEKKRKESETKLGTISTQLIELTEDEDEDEDDVRGGFCSSRSVGSGNANACAVFGNENKAKYCSR